MIKFVRIATFIIAAIITIVSIFYVDPNAELAKARQAYGKGDMDQALRMARRANWAFSEDNGKTEAFYLQAKAASKMNWKSAAIGYLNQLLSLDNENARALLFRGELKYQLGNSEEAVSDLDRGLSLAPQNTSKPSLAYYRSQRGLAYLALGQQDEAQSDAISALNLAANLSEAHDLMSKVYEEKGDLEKALAECEQAYQLAVERDKLSFMTPKGQELSNRLVDLKVKNARMKRSK